MCAYKYVCMFGVPEEALGMEFYTGNFNINASIQNLSSLS